MTKQVIPVEAVEAAAAAIQAETYGAEWSAKIARIALNAAAPYILPAPVLHVGAYGTPNV